MRFRIRNPDINYLFLVSRSSGICRRHPGRSDGETLLGFAHSDRRAQPAGGGPAHCPPPPERPQLRRRVQRDAPRGRLPLDGLRLDGPALRQRPHVQEQSGGGLCRR